MDTAITSHYSPQLQSALYYLNHNCFVVPCCPVSETGACLFPGHRHTDPKSIGKQPILGEGWQYLRLTQEEVIEAWTRVPTANIGVMLVPSQLVVLDTDSLEAELEASRRGLTPGPQVRTAQGTHHYYLNNDGALAGTNKIKSDGWPFDVLLRGIVIGAGSRHRSGMLYTWSVSFEEFPLEEPPMWVAEIARTVTPGMVNGHTVPPLPDELPDLDLSAVPVESWVKHLLIRGQAPPGFTQYESRSEAVFAVISALVRAGLDDPTIAALILNPDYAISSKPRERSAHWVATEIARVRNKEEARGHQNGAQGTTETTGMAPEQAQTQEEYTWTDTGNAERYAAQHGHRMRWCPPWKKWVFYNGKYWQDDSLEMALAFTKETVRTLYQQGANEEDEAVRARIVKFALLSESDHARRAMERLAKAELVISPTIFDTHIWKLNCQNGTVDLRTGVLSPHNSADYLTKITGCDFQPDAECPMWEGFLASIFQSNDEVIDWLQRALGYSLSGSTIEHVMFLCHGGGSNGKSTLLEILRCILHLYAEQATAQTFLHSDKDTVRNDLAKLRSARFVLVSETEQGRRLAEALVKGVTSGDAVTARFLFSEYFTYTPELKLWMATNHKPEIRGTDYAIWRRLRLIPFTVTFTEEQQDKQLMDKLKAEQEGILAWLVRGCVRWSQEGLIPTPASISAATQSYREEMDTLATFLEDCCVAVQGFSTPSTILYDRYKTWADSVGVSPDTQTKFSLRMVERGYTKSKNVLTRRFQWHNLAIRVD